MMNDFITVYSAEVMRRLRSRAFLIGLLIGGLGIAMMVRLPAIIDSFANQSYRVVLSGDPKLVAEARPLLRKDYNITGTMPPVESPTAADMQRHGKASAIILLQRASRGLHITVFAKDPGGVSATQLRRDLLPLNIGFATNLSDRQVSALLKMPIDVRPLESKFGTAAAADQARVVANVLIFLLYLLIVLNAQAHHDVRSGRKDEPHRRVADRLRASRLAAGWEDRVFGDARYRSDGGVGRNRLFARLKRRRRSNAFERSRAATSERRFFAERHLADRHRGIRRLLLDRIFADGHHVRRARLADQSHRRHRQLGGPFFIPIVAALLIAMTALQVPDAPPIVAASFIPLIAPFVMFARIVVSSVPMWEIGLSLAINIAAIWALALIGGKIYRIGMLLYGRPPKLTQLWHALRA